MSLQGSALVPFVLDGKEQVIEASYWRVKNNRPVRLYRPERRALLHRQVPLSPAVSSKAQHKQTRLFLLRHNRSPPHFRSPPAAPFKRCISFRLPPIPPDLPSVASSSHSQPQQPIPRTRAATPQEQGTPADEKDLDFQATKLRLEEQLLRNQLKQAEVEQKLKRAKKEPAADEKSEGRAKKVKKK
ncbi:hypothetical protein JCM11641_000632 [Rhodosporidiobolus odoratus]